MIKAKKSVWLCLVLAILLIGMVCFSILENGDRKAYAATVPKYTMTFSGTYTNLSWGANGLQSQLNDQTKISVKKVYSSGATEDVIMYLSGSSVSGSATLANYGYINFSTVTFSSSVSASLKIYDSQGKEVASGNDSITATLSDGQYKATLDKTKQSGAGYTKWGYSLSLYSYFNIDSTAPVGTIYAGGRAVASGVTVKEAFSYTATDTGSGVSKLEYKTPSSTAWKTYASGVVIPADAETGKYSFRAIDGVGNMSTTTVILAAAHTHEYSANTVSPTCTKEGYTVYTCSGCGDSYMSEKTKALGHSYKATMVTASCTSGGYMVYTCERCTDSHIGNQTEPAGHSYSASVKQSTCTSYGYITYTCAKCGYNYTESQSEPLGHSYSATTAASSCTEEGYTTYKCTRCGVSYTDSPTQATGHSYVASITEPTCTERGYTIYTCTKCGDSYRENETAATGHTYVTETISATCIERGETVYTCTKCGASYNGNESEPLGHNYVTETVSATCTEHGGTVYTCTRCGESYNGRGSEPLGHSYVTETVSANCEEGGYTLHTCSRCGVSYTDSVTQPLGHNFVMTTKEAECEEFGKTVYTCQVCGYEREEETGVYPTGHSYSNFIVKAATCTEDGERRYVCDKCGDEYTEIIAAPGHNYAITDSTSENGKTTRVYTCTVCGDSYTQELGDQYEEVSSYIEDLFEQYRPYMIWVFLATTAIWSIVMGVFFAIAHKNEDKEKARKMIVNYFIGLVVIFAIFVACPYLVRGIAAMVT